MDTSAPFRGRISLVTEDQARRKISYITDIPPELRSHVRSYCDTGALATLCASSKAIALETEPLLYQTISLKTSPQQPLWEAAFSSCMDTLINNHGKARFVKNLAVKFEDCLVALGNNWGLSESSSRFVSDLCRALPNMGSLTFFSYQDGGETTYYADDRIETVLHAGYFSLHSLFISEVRYYEDLVRGQPQLEVICLWDANTFQDYPLFLEEIPDDGDHSKPAIVGLTAGPSAYLTIFYCPRLFNLSFLTPFTSEFNSARASYGMQNDLGFSREIWEADGGVNVTFVVNDMAEPSLVGLIKLIPGIHAVSKLHSVTVSTYEPQRNCSLPGIIKLLRPLVERGVGQFSIEHYIGPLPQRCVLGFSEPRAAECYAELVKIVDAIDKTEGLNGLKEVFFYVMYISCFKAERTKENPQWVITRPKMYD
ncbi:hypothetical protein DFP72DRAFT_1176126 [Ephemerocybe angulata]|uniref:Uncharacterized protein n=1 Tax=Ephemerocybe angulata TaxID=980116 RepID=A0A8H6HFV6_9AGAR|nr:hypothetical protein DFP72DRAFT_1176126 [Tulosesus angulatus]